MDPGQILAVIRLITRGPKISKDIRDDVAKNGKPSSGSLLASVITAIFVFGVMFVLFFGLILFIFSSLNK